MGKLNPEVKPMRFLLSHGFKMNRVATRPLAAQRGCNSS